MLVDAALRSRATVFFLTAAMMALGLSAYLTLPREKFPDVNVPVIIVSTIYPGAAPVEVEAQLTHAIERELTGLAGLKKLTSKSEESLSVVTAEFLAGTDIDTALQKVRDRVDLAVPDFPEEAEEPILREINFSEVPILQVNLSGDVGPVVLKQIAEDLQDEIETIPGVLRAGLVGGVEREVQVDVDPQRLRLYGLALDDVVGAVEDENVAIPGGDMDLGDVTYAVRVPGEVENPLAVADFVIKAYDGRPIFVRDVAEVKFGFRDRASLARIDGDESVALMVQKRSGANVVEIVDAVKRLVAEQEQLWPSGVKASLLADQSKEILRQVSDLENSILSGLFLVILVLMFALGLRNSVFVALSIPFSILLTCLVLELLSVALNMVVLFSLVLAVGMLVDNAVVVIENIYRHMQEGLERRAAAARATHEVGAAIAVSTLTTVGAFSPLFLWPGIIGDFMSYLPLTVCIALMASLLVAFTINPVICSVFMRAEPVSPAEAGAIDPGAAGTKREGWLKRWGQRIERRGQRIERWGQRIVEGYRRILVWCLDHRLVTLGATLLCFAGLLMVYATWNSGMELIADEQPNRIKIDIDLPPGSRLEKTDAIARDLEQRLAGLTDLGVLASSIGAGSQNEQFDSGGRQTNVGRLTLDLVDRKERRQESPETLLQARQLAGAFPGVDIFVDKMDDGLQVGDPLAIEVTGDDFAVLGDIAARIRQQIEGIPGLVSLTDDFDLARPEVVVRVDRIEASRLGLTMKNVAGTVRTAINGTQASTYRRGDEEIDVTVRLAATSRRSIEDLKQLAIVSENGGEQIPLAGVAEISRSSALTSIKHKDRRRMVTISGKVTAANLAEPVRAEARQRIEQMADLLPAGYALRFGGQQDEENEARDFLSGAFAYAVVIVLALMVGKFDSLTIPLIVISSVLMSMVGVLIGLLVTGLPFSIVLTGVGVISLAGIVVNNAIVLLDYAEKLRAQGMARRELIVKTGLRRLRPVLLTATTTILGLMPLTTGIEWNFRAMALTVGSESSDYWRSMGVAVIFGLAFATFLTLVMVPVLYDLVLSLQERRRSRESDSSTPEDTASGDQEADQESQNSAEPAPIA